MTKNIESNLTSRFLILTACTAAIGLIGIIVTVLLFNKTKLGMALTSILRRQKFVKDIEMHAVRSDNTLTVTPEHDRIYPTLSESPNIIPK